MAYIVASGAKVLNHYGAIDNLYILGVKYCLNVWHVGNTDMLLNYINKELGMAIHPVEYRKSTANRHVQVNRSRTPEEMLNATKCTPWHLEKNVRDQMPRTNDEEVEVFFFRVGYDVSLAGIEKEYKLRGLKADPYAQAAVYETDLSVIGDYPSATFWKDEDGNFCCLCFGLYDGKPGFGLGVDTGNYEWGTSIWFAGVRN